MVPEAVDHAVFRPGDRDEAGRTRVAAHGVTTPFILFVSSLWPYKNCDGLMRAFALAKPSLDGHQLGVVGPVRDPGVRGATSAPWRASSASPTTSSGSAGCPSRRP